MPSLRMTLDNGVSYDLTAMFIPRRVGQKNAWLAFWQNLRGWKKGFAIPFESRQLSTKGTLAWMVILVCNSLSLLLLPLMAPFGYSMRAYSFHTQEDAKRLHTYKQELPKIYARLKHIEDPTEHRKQLSEAILQLRKELGIDPRKS